MQIFKVAAGVCLVLFVFGALAQGADPKPAAGEWRYWGGDAGGARYSPLDQINRGNVTKLTRAWTFHTREVSPGVVNSDKRSIPAFEATPLIVHGVLYFTTPGNRAIALEPETGKKIWEYDPQAGLDIGDRNGGRAFSVTRGVSYWESGDERRILFGTHDGRLIALDARTGQPCRDFGKGGAINLREGAADKYPKDKYAATPPPAIYKDLVITGAEVPERPGRGPSGIVRAFNVRTGKLEWVFHTVPRPGEAGHETWEKEAWEDRTGVNVWSIMSVDLERGLLFLPIGSASYDFYGGDRKGKDLFANCLVALDAATGKLRWYFQMVHHDVWDYDLPAEPVLLTVRREGHEIPAVAQVTKMGLVFILDRTTGKPLFQVDERPVHKSDVPGEETWPTQPIPQKPLPLSRVSLTRDELTTLPESREYCTKLFDSLVSYGIYTPYMKEPTLVLPGTLGGATWSGGSFDPTLGYLFVNTNEMGAVGQMKQQPSGSPMPWKRTSDRGEYARFWDLQNHPCVKTPWANLTAINVATGEFAWRTPLGVDDELEARGIHNTGAANLGGTIATAGGLVFIAGTIDSRFRAFDSKTGKLLWETRLEASGHAVPSTFLGRDGRQYVVIAAGGAGYVPTAASDTLDAFRLP